VNEKEKRAAIERIVASPTYRVASQDLDFLNREDLRPVRLMLELLKPERTMAERDIRSTVVVFGSTRIPEPGEARARLRAARERAAADPGNPALAREAATAERLLARSRYYDEAREFARLVSSSRQVEGRCDYVIVTGGGPGIMEAANRGAHDVPAMSIGLNVTLPEEQYPNPYITPDLCFQFRYFAIRKMHFMLRAKAMVAFPGGYGTLDEVFEALTLVQTGKMAPFPIVLVGREYWETLVRWPYLVEEGMIAPADLDLVHFAETAAEAWSAIEAFHR
jgi:uncharacterized protein (TIGR00730 family)